MAQVEKPGWDEVVCAGANQMSSPIGDDVAILGLDRGEYYGLNPTGARIWELLQKPIRVRDIHTAIVEEFEVEEDTAREDLLALLGQLREAGLIEVR
jgi:coenzyme PQQ synthesis protein D (PqqD)